MRVLVAFCAGIVLLTAGLAIAEDDNGLTKADMPQAVLQAFATSYPGVVATEYSTKTVDGQLRYEIETKAGDLEKDFVYAEDGTFIQIEEDLPVESLPATITESVKQAYPAGVSDEADKITKGSTIQYEITVEVQETEYELLIASDGKIISTSQVADDDHESGDTEEAEVEEDD